MTAYIPGLPGPKSHGFHAHPKPAGIPAATPVRVEVPEEEEPDIQVMRIDTSPGAGQDKFGGGGSSFRPSFKGGGFLPNFRQSEGNAQEMPDETRFTRDAPRKEARPQPRSPMPIEEEPEAPPRESPQELDDELLRALLAGVPAPPKFNLAARFALVPRHLLERCLAAGCHSELSSEAGYCMLTRRLLFRVEDLESDFPIVRALAQGIDHTLGGDDFASRRALAVLAALPGPGWKPEDFFAQELARYLLGQRGSPLEAYVTYLCNTVVAAEVREVLSVAPVDDDWGLLW